MSSSPLLHQAAQKAVEARKFKTPRIENAIVELAVSFVTVDICGADANAVAQYVRKLEAALSAVESAVQQQAEPAALAIKTYTDGTSATGTAPLPDHSPAQQDARKDAWVEAVWAAMRDLSLTSDAVKPMNIHTVRLFCEEAWKRLPALQHQEVPREPVAPKMQKRERPLPPLPDGKGVVRHGNSGDDGVGWIVDFDCEGPLSHQPAEGEELFTSDQMREYARDASPSTTRQQEVGSTPDDGAGGVWGTSIIGSPEYQKEQRDKNTRASTLLDGATPMQAPGESVLAEVVKWALAGHISEAGVTVEACTAIRAAARGAKEVPRG